eukprot:767213-Hanusia_phi.AAC.7
MTWHSAVREIWATNRKSSRWAGSLGRSRADVDDASRKQRRKLLSLPWTLHFQQSLQFKISGSSTLQSSTSPSKKLLSIVTFPDNTSACSDCQVCELEPTVRITGSISDAASIVLCQLLVELGMTKPNLKNHWSYCESFSMPSSPDSLLRSKSPGSKPSGAI